jgi:hypothetical protein
VEKKQHGDIIALVTEMLQLQKEHAVAARDKFAEKAEPDDALTRWTRRLTQSCIGCMT